MTARCLLSSLCIVSLLLVGGASAHAQQPEDAPASGSPAGRWHLAFLGGVLTPLGATAETHQQGLAASLRLGWSGALGLGADLSLDYSPLPRHSSDGGSGDDSFDTHFLSAGLMPRLTLGNQTFRMWLGGGGAVTYERTRRTRDQVLQEVISVQSFAALGAAGAELHFLSGGGLQVVASYMRTYGDSSYELLGVVGGLVLDF